MTTQNPQGTESTPADTDSGYHVERGSAALAIQPAQPVPGAARTRRAAVAGGTDGSGAQGKRKRLAAAAPSPEARSSAGSDTVRLQGMVVEDVRAVADVNEVKDIVQQMIRKHLGWLVVWGCAFGGLIGLSVTVAANL